MASPLLQNCVGSRPETIFEDFFPDGICGLAVSREARSIAVGTRNGRLCLLSPSGDRIRESLNYGHLSRVVLCDSGEFGVAVTGTNSLAFFDNGLKPLWQSSITGRITSLAIAPYGGHIAFATESARIHIVTNEKKEVVTIDTRRPMDHLAFLSESPHLVAAAEFGQMCRYDLKGNEVWTEHILNNVGDLSVSEGGKRLFLAAFNHGVQVYGLDGDQLGSFAIDGIPARVCCSATRGRVAVLTLENRIFLLNFEGSIQWAVDISQDPPEHLAMAPLGDRLLIATSSGCLLSAAWP